MPPTRKGAGGIIPLWDCLETNMKPKLKDSVNVGTVKNEMMLKICYFFFDFI